AASAAPSSRSSSTTAPSPSPPRSPKPFRPRTASSRKPRRARASCNQVSVPGQARGTSTPAPAARRPLGNEDLQTPALRGDSRAELSHGPAEHVFGALRHGAPVGADALTVGRYTTLPEPHSVSFRYVQELPPDSRAVAQSNRVEGRRGRRWSRDEGDKRPREEWPDRGFTSDGDAARCAADRGDVRPLRRRRRNRDGCHRGSQSH